MLILGIVRLFQPVHGYDVRRELLSWHADEWASIAPGSVYHALKKLADEGLLREVATEQVGARPARTSYEITPLGEEEFQDLLRRGWWDMKPMVNPFWAAYSFMGMMPREQSIGALRHRAQRLRLIASGMEVRKVAEMTEPYVTHIVELIELEIEKSRLEADWCDRVADKLEKGEFHASDDAGPPT
jgi:DNA-binding PadR family transcriptional regulator